MKSHWSCVGAACALAAVLVGCKPPELSVVTVAPPGRIAELDSSSNTVKITRGVALAVSCAKNGAACTNMKLSVAAPNIASAYLSASDEIAAGGYPTDPNAIDPSSIVVITGNAVGTTTVDIESDTGPASMNVEVVAP